MENSDLGACEVRIDGVWIYKGEILNASAQFGRERREERAPRANRAPRQGQRPARAPRAAKPANGEGGK